MFGMTKTPFSNHHFILHKLKGMPHALPNSALCRSILLLVLQTEFRAEEMPDTTGLGADECIGSPYPRNHSMLG